MEDGQGVIWPVVQSTSGLCWYSQFICRTTLQEGSRLVITSKTSVRAMAESQMDNQTASVAHMEVVPLMKTTSWGVTRVLGRWRQELNLVSMKQSLVLELSRALIREEMDREETERMIE